MSDNLYCYDLTSAFFSDIHNTVRDAADRLPRPAGTVVCPNLWCRGRGEWHEFDDTGNSTLHLCETCDSTGYIDDDSPPVEDDSPNEAVSDAWNWPRGRV